MLHDHNCVNGALLVTVIQLIMSLFYLVKLESGYCSYHLYHFILLVCFEVTERKLPSLLCLLI